MLLTEARWMSCTNAQEMLWHIYENTDVRRLRLFACACARRIARLLRDERTWQAIEAAERFADGEGRKKDLQKARSAALDVYDPCDAAKAAAAAAGPIVKGDVWMPLQAPFYAGVAAVNAVRQEAINAALAERLPLAQATARAEPAAAAESAAQANLLRDIFGNLFRPQPLALDPAWLTRNDRTVERLARAIYDEHLFGDLPILADALEEAVCDNAELLAHCRGPGPHARGCWAIDLLLGYS